MSCILCGQHHPVDGECAPSAVSGAVREPTVVRDLAPEVPWSHDSGTSGSPAPSMEDLLAGQPPEAVDPLIGSTIGSFRIVRELGRGGMGTVYLGEQTVIGSKVAIKFLHPHLASNAALVQRFWAEARSVNVIGHANIISIFDMNVLPPNRYYLVMEYLEGRALHDVAIGALPAKVTVPILAQVCDALQAAHRHGVVHRDLKPENIFLVSKGRQDNFVKVLDFGIAKLRLAEMRGDQTAAGLIIGTPDYMSPEQANGEPVDGRSDLYSLGVIAYQLATGRLPFAGAGVAAVLVAHAREVPTAPHLVNPEVPLALSHAIMKALEKKPAQRYQQAEEFAAALEAALLASTTQGPVAMWGQAPAAPSARAPAPEPEPAAAFSPPDPHRSEAFAVPPARAEAPRGAPGAAPRPPAASAPRSAPAPAEPAFASSPTARAPAPRVESPRFRLVVADVHGRELAGRQGEELSRGGVFIRSDGPLPALLSRVKVSIPELSFAADAEVVRHVLADQARAWGMSPGFGVQFVGLPPAMRQLIDAQSPGSKPPTPVHAPQAPSRDDHLAAEELPRYLARTQDHYAYLKLPSDAHFEDIRARIRDLKRALNILKERLLSPGQHAQVEEAHARIQRTFDVLAYPSQRLEYDAEAGNFAGVARCIAAGVSATDLEAARKRFLAHHAGAETNGHIRFVSGQAFENARAFKEALESYEKSLRADPLNLKTHHKYWALKRRVAGN